MPKRLRCIDLFSGCGGLALGLKEVAEVVAYCEVDPASQCTLRKNMKQGHLDQAPIIDDVRHFPASLPRRHGPPLKRVDMVAGGFPCQDISFASDNRRGLKGKRSGLFYAAMQVVQKYRPTFILLENVASITSQPEILRPVLRTMDKAGYDCRWIVLSAAQVGAPHERRRWFMLGTRRGAKLPRTAPPVQPHEVLAAGGRRRWNARGWPAHPRSTWEIDTRRVPRLIADSADRAERLLVQERLKQCGNIAVPAQVRAAFQILTRGLADQRCAQENHTPVAGRARVLPRWGMSGGGGKTPRGRPELFGQCVPLLPSRPSMQLQIQDHGKPRARTRRSGNPRKHARMTGVLQLPRWSTPRASVAGLRVPDVMPSSNHAKASLAHQLRFEKRSSSRTTLRRANPEYVEWMVGLPRGWTEARCGDTR